MAYKTIHTTHGLRAMAQAQAMGVPINLLTMAVGDGAGNPVEPDPAQTQLVREVYRAAVNRVYQKPGDATHFIAELVIPANVAGFTLREAAVFDADGALFVVGNLPPTYKPTDGEGAYSDTIVRLEFLVSNAGVVTLQVDPNVAVASQAWVVTNRTAATIIPGGTTSQVLRKKSNADGDVEWSDPDVASVVVDCLEEGQELAAGQTVVTLTTLTTRGLAVYINGERLPNTAWAKDLDDPTKLTLATPAVGGEAFLGAQNEPTGSAPAPLERHRNLADLDSKATARQNLDVFSKAEARQMAPAGMVGTFPLTAAPTGWLKCNGAAVSRAAYADLFAVIGTTFGAGDGFNTFNLPDFRGEFPRFWDDARGVNPGRGIGTWEAQQVQRHKHMTSWGEAYDNGRFGRSNGRSKVGSNATDYDNFNYHTNDGSDDDGPVNPWGVVGAETRPRNVALLACIKF